MTSSINQRSVSLKNLPNRYRRKVNLWTQRGWIDGNLTRWKSSRDILGRYNHWVSITGRLWRSVCFEELRIRPIRGDDRVMTSSFLITPSRADFIVFSCIIDRNVETWREEMERSRGNRPFDSFSRKGLS